MHPVEAGPNEQLDRLRDHRLDVGYIGLISPEAHPDLQVRELARFPLRVVLPADHRLARRAHVRVSDLVGESLILTEHANAPLYNRWLCSALAEAGVTLPVSRTTGRAAAVLALVAAGCGISCFPAPVLDLPHPGAVALPLRGLPDYAFSLAWRRGDLATAVHRFVTIAVTTTASGRGPR
jgi:DNA-binding transcriptional LysR family regulator